MAPGAFLQACAAGEVWVYCKTCQKAKNFNDVEHLRCIENPSYWGNEPWWQDTREFRCPDCGSVEQSVLERRGG